MLVSLFLVALVLGLYVFIAVAPQEAIQITLAFVWGLMLLSVLVSPFLH